MDYSIQKDIEAIMSIGGYSETDLATELGVARITVKRWLSGKNTIPDSQISQIYDFAFKNGIKLNSLKAQLCKEDYERNKHKILFHGSKSGLDGKLDIKKTRTNNDFGQGIYCGESVAQSAMFVSGYSASSLYIIKADLNGLKKCEYTVDQDWMLAVAYFRGTLSEYQNHPKVKKAIKKILNSDYIIAPIADNKMFETIDDFINGNITNVQCEHCLSATNLGKQYVFKSERSVKNLTLLHRCFLSASERDWYVTERQMSYNENLDKIKLAMRTYRGQGQYIDEVLT